MLTCVLTFVTTAIDRVPATTISIFPDEAHKDINHLNIQIPTLSAGYRIVPKLEGLTIQDVKKAFKPYKPMPLPSSPQPPSPRAGEGGEKYASSGSAPLSPLGRGAGGEGSLSAGQTIDYEGRHLFTGEVVEKMQLSLPLLESGVGAVSYYVKQLETICKLRGLHPILAPLIQTFLETMLFEPKTNLFDPALVARLADSDVGEHLRAVFVPLIRSRTTTTESRLAAEAPKSLNTWKPYQVTLSERRPALEAAKTLFNLVTCNRELEVAVAKFCDRAPDVVAFAKNAGSQCLRVDYLAQGDRLAFYTPDFCARTLNGHYYLIETKGREDRDVPLKAKAAIAWCEAASLAPLAPLGRGVGGEGQWHYLYIPQGVFERMAGDTVTELDRACAPALQNLLQAEEFQDLPLFVNLGQSDEAATAVDSLIDLAILNALPSRYRRAADQAVMLYRFFENKEGMNYAPVFTALLGSLDEVAKGFIVRRLQPELPITIDDQKTWFDPDLYGLDRKSEQNYRKLAQNLKRTLVFNNGLSLIGLLRSCLDYALNDTTQTDGVFAALHTQFRFQGGRKLLETITRINDFRNTYIAHQEKELTDRNLAEQELKIWIETLQMIGK